MLLRTSNKNDKGVLFISLIEVSSKSGGTYNVVSFAKRTTDIEAAKMWHEKLLKSAALGKWNIHNTQDMPGIEKVLNLEYIPAMTAGQDTLEFGFSKKDPRLKEWVEHDRGVTSYNLIPCETEVIENPTVVMVGGWDPHLVCDPAGGVCSIKWNCGSRSKPEKCETKISYKGKPSIISVHPYPGTVSHVTYYVWEFPGMEVIDDRLTLYP